MSGTRIRPSFFLYHRVKVGKLEKNVKLGVHDGKKHKGGPRGQKLNFSKFQIFDLYLLHFVLHDLKW